MTDRSSGVSGEVTVVVGTRPELIKMAPVVRAIQSSTVLDLRLLHTGQHYDDSLSESFFRALDLPTPDVHLGVESGSHGEQTAKALVEIERDIVEHDPSFVLAQGDTNAVLSAALAASKLPATFGHVEAGIRSFDRSMPEETNRVVADHVSDLLFAPTETAVENLDAEGITDGVFMTGNTVVDACLGHRDIAGEESDIVEEFGLEPKGYVAATIHRPRNTDDPDRLRRIVTTLDGLSVPVVLPAHPRTKDALDQLGFEPTGSLRLTGPLGYLDFLRLISEAAIVVTDSGGVQEEASILEVPCLTVRPNTERPETVEAGVNELVEPGELEDRLAHVLESKGEQMVGAPHLYGDGNAGQKIADRLERYLADRT